MSLFSRPKRKTIVALASMFMLAGCTLTPVYQDNTNSKYQISYTKPASVVEQTIIQDLAFKLGRSSNPAYQLSLSTSTSTRAIHGVSSQFVRSETEATVRSKYVLKNIDTDEQIAAGERFASAVYQNSSQNIANNTAVADAYQRAAKDVARQIELLIIAALNEDKP